MKREVKFVICVGNRGCAASLELRKMYKVLPDEEGARQHQIRVIDESGEDYLYPAKYFVPVRLRGAVSGQFVRRLRDRADWISLGDGPTCSYCGAIMMRKGS